MELTIQSQMQCCFCNGYLFFTPWPCDAFSCCQKHNETYLSIDLATGVSPAIKKHGLEGKPCSKFRAGQSPCVTSDPQNLNLVIPLRQAGETHIRIYYKEWMKSRK
jgi:hypothetical protein